MSKLVYLTGKSRAGKDEFAKLWIKHNPSFIKLAFADEIKNMTSKILGIPREDLDNPETKEKYRQFLIFGGQLGRELDEDTWTRILSNNLCPQRKDFIISDLRFLNEADYIEDASKYYGHGKAISVRIKASEENRIARGANPKFFNDISEVNMDSVEDTEFDLVINNNGTLEELEAQVITSSNLLLV